MNFPRRIPKPAKRETRWRSPAHLAFVRSHECCIAGCNGRPIEAAHVRMGSGAGIGFKPDDFRAVSLCGGPHGHHQQQHNVGERTFWAGIDVEALIDEFCRQSPKAAEIRKVKAERNG